MTGELLHRTVGRSLRAECTDHPGWPRYRELGEQRLLGDIRAALAAAAQLGRHEPGGQAPPTAVTVT
jgi:hypothetical protein